MPTGEGRCLRSKNESVCHQRESMSECVMKEQVPPPAEWSVCVCAPAEPSVNKLYLKGRGAFKAGLQKKQ